MDSLFELIQEEKGMSGYVFYHDLQLKKFLIPPNSKGADLYMKAILGMDDLNLIVDVKKVDSSIKLNRRSLMFLNGNMVLEHGKIPVLVVESVTPADDLNIELWEKTLFLMKKLVIGSDNEAILKFKSMQNGELNHENEELTKSKVLEDENEESDVEII